MKVLNIQDIVVTIECDCGAVLTFKRYDWQKFCHKCSQSVIVSELADRYAPASTQQSIADKIKISADRFKRYGTPEQIRKMMEPYVKKKIERRGGYRP